MRARRHRAADRDQRTSATTSGGPAGASTDAGDHAAGGVAGASDDEALLATPLDDTDLSDRLVAASGRARARSTTILVIVAIFVFGFALGAMTGRGAAEFAAQIEAQQADDEPAVHTIDADPDLLRGVVRALDGDEALVEQADGTVVRVRITATTSVATAHAAELPDLPPGTPVRVRGEFDDVGVVTATEFAELLPR